MLLSRLALSARLAATRSTTSNLRAVSSLHARSPLSKGELKSPGMTDVAVVYVTAPSEVARSLARHLVEATPQRFAACVNLLPGVTSIYSWKGKTEELFEKRAVSRKERKWEEAT